MRSMTAAAGSVVVSVQPAVETKPPRVSTLTTVRSANSATTSSRKSTSVNAAVPRIDARRAGRERVAHGLDRAQAAAVLDRHAELAGDALEVVEVLRRARARAVEVDDVQVARARLRPTRSRPRTGLSS